MKKEKVGDRSLHRSGKDGQGIAEEKLNWFQLFLTEYSLEVYNNFLRIKLDNSPL